MSALRTFVVALLLLHASYSFGQLVGQSPDVGAGQLDGQADPLPAGAALRMGSLRWWHSTRLTAVDFSADDRRIATADSNGTVRVWGVATGRRLLELPEKAGSEVAFSPDGKLLATGGYYQQVIAIWDAATGERLRIMKQNARSLAFSRDGRLLVGAGRDAVVRLWNPASGELIRELKGHEGGLFAVAISPDGKLIASGGGGDGTSPQKNEVRLWDAESGRELAQLEEDEGQLEGLKGWIYAFDFSADGKLLAVASPYAVRVWDVPRRKQLQRIDKCSYDVAFSPAGTRLAMPGELGVYDPTTARRLVELPGDVGVYGCLEWSHDGTRIVTGNKLGQVQLWDAQSGKEIVRRSGHELGVRAVAFSPDGSLIASLSRADGTLRLWGAASGRQLRKFDVQWKGPDTWWNREGSDVFFPAYGREVAAWTYDGTIRFWEPGSLKSRTVKVGTRSATGMAMSRDGARAAVVEYDGSSPEVGIYELDGGTRLVEFDPFAGRHGSDFWISALAFSPDGKTLAVGLLLEGHSHPGERPSEVTVQLWDAKTGKRIRSFRRDPNAPGMIAFSPDGKWLASAATGTTPVQVWNVEDGAVLFQLAEKDNDRSWYESSPLAFSPDGRLLASATKQNEIVVWELATRSELKRLEGHAKTVTALAFSPDGKTLVSGSDDTTLLVWNVSGAAGAAADRPRLDAAKLEALWSGLAGADSDAVSGAIAALAAAPDQATTLIGERLRPPPARDAAQLPKLIAELGVGDEARRAKTREALEQYGVKASPALFAALREKPAVEVRREIEAVLETIGEYPVPPDDLRRARAIQILERIATPAAEQILQGFASADPPTQFSRDAQAALARLAQRRRVPETKVAPDAR